MGSSAQNLNQPSQFLSYFADPCLVLDQKGTILDLNDSALKILGIKRHQALDETLIDVLAAKEIYDDEYGILRNFVDKLGRHLPKEPLALSPTLHIEILLPRSSTKAFHYLVRLDLGTPMAFNLQNADLAASSETCEPQEYPQHVPYEPTQVVTNDDHLKFKHGHDYFQMAKYSILSEATGGLIHGVRNPLSIAMGFTELIESAFGRADESVQAALGKLPRQILKLKESLERIRERVTGYAALFQPVSTKESLTTFSVKGSVEFALGLMESQLQNRQIKLSFTSGTAEYWISSKQAAFQQVLMILIIRARNAFSLNSQQRFKTLKIACEPSEVGCQLLFEDNAVGFQPPPKLPNTWEDLLSSFGNNLDLTAYVAEFLLRDLGLNFSWFPNSQDGTTFVISVIGAHTAP